MTSAAYSGDIQARGPDLRTGMDRTRFGQNNDATPATQAAAFQAAFFAATPPGGNRP